jgi:hypothetical protein
MLFVKNVVLCSFLLRLLRAQASTRKPVPSVRPFLVYEYKLMAGNDEADEMSPATMGRLNETSALLGTVYDRSYHSYPHNININNNTHT